MDTTIEGIIDLRIDGGWSKKIPISIGIHAYDIVNGTIQSGPADTTIDLQPSGDKGDIKFLCITSDKYDNNNKLTYKTAAAATPLSLERAHILIGKSMTSLLNAAPAQLIFHNETGDPINIQAFVGRDAISTPGGP
jgi:hypothetical protein